MIEDTLIKISKQSGLCWGRYGGTAYIMLDRKRPALRYYDGMDALSLSSIEYAAVGFLGEVGEGVLLLTQGDICVNMCSF